MYWTFIKVAANMDWLTFIIGKNGAMYAPKMVRYVQPSLPSPFIYLEILVIGSNKSNFVIFL